MLLVTQTPWLYPTQPCWCMLSLDPYINEKVPLSHLGKAVLMSHMPSKRSQLFTMPTHYERHIDCLLDRAHPRHGADLGHDFLMPYLLQKEGCLQSLCPLETD